MALASEGKCGTIYHSLMSMLTAELWSPMLYVLLPLSLFHPPDVA